MIAYCITIGLLALFVTLLIRAEYNEKQKPIYIIKPLSTMLVILVAVFSFFMVEIHCLNYSIGIILALLFSFGGDVALMFKSKSAFLIGLILFLLAHIIYSIVFTIFSGFVKADVISATILISLAIAIYFYLYSGLGGVKIPVFCYVLIISLMVNRAISTFYGDFFSQNQAILISLGAGLFYISDLLLAINKFKKPFKFHRLNLVFYYSGQLLLALSTAFFNLK